MNKVGEPPHILKLIDLSKSYAMLNFLIDGTTKEIIEEVAVSKEAGRLIGILYDAILEKYNNPEDEQVLKSLNILCVRLVFLFYAEDAGLFKTKSLFTDYLKNALANDLHDKLQKLFEILDTEEDKRPEYLSPDLNDFPYVNGGLFKDTNIVIPLLDENIKDLMVKTCGESFDWSSISPTIFGAVFESTLNAKIRRSGGMHYTSIQNIRKVIKPLFLDDLTNEFKEIAKLPKTKNRDNKLSEYIDKLGSLKFLDPACGSGNFLTETYIQLRRLENEAIKLKNDGERKFMLDTTSSIKVRLENFIGIEIDNFAATVAKTAMWIAEHQMLKETEKILYHNLDYFPLIQMAHIVCENALKLNWDAVVNADIKNFFELTHEKQTIVDILESNVNDGKNYKNYFKVNYIIGNPPFVGSKYSDEKQKKDMDFVFHDTKINYRTLNYVSCWYYKALNYIKNTNIKVAFVSTNSICQGEQVELMWKPLLENKLEILFAYRTFIWDSESDEKAHVHCVIIGFKHLNDSNKNDKYVKKIYLEGNVEINAKNINPYIIDAENLIIESNNKPLISGIRKMVAPNKPCDYNHLKIESDEYQEFIRKCPESKKWIKRMVGAQEFINNKERYCLWLVNCSPNELKKMPMVIDRVERCKKARLEANTSESLKLAKTPTLFREQLNPEKYLLVPCVSSERRHYIPIGFLDKNTIPIMGTLIVPDATLVDFAIMTSGVHMAWMRTVAGRLKSDFRYSKDVVYNNFPWPIDTTNSDLTEKEKLLIKNGYPIIDEEIKEKLQISANNILKAREEYPDSSLAELYDPDLMNPKLSKAHSVNDKLVLKIYGIKPGDEAYADAEACVAILFKLYKMLISNK